MLGGESGAALDGPAHWQVLTVLHLVLKYES